MRSSTQFVTSRRRPSEAGNCFVWGCVSLLCFTVLIAVVGGLVVRHQVIQLRENYTATAATELPVAEIAGEDLQKLVARFNAFKEDPAEGEEREALTLNQDEFNALIQNHPDFEDMNGHVYITIEGDDITGEITVPLQGIPMMSGRYFNGTATFDIAFEYGRLSVFLENASVRGKPLPEWLMSEVRSTNFAEDAQTDPEVRELFENIESLTVEDGVITITPK